MVGKVSLSFQQKEVRSVVDQTDENKCEKRVAMEKVLADVLEP
jgi:hypothetical protein